MSEIRIKSQGAIKLFESDNTSHVTIASPASLSANRTITIPDADVTLGAGTTINNNADNRVITGSGTANTLEAEANVNITSGGNLLVGSSTASTGYSRVSLVGGHADGTGANSGVQMTYNSGAYGGGAITTPEAEGGGFKFWNFTGNVGSESYTEVMKIDGAGIMTRPLQSGFSATKSTSSQTVSGAYVNVNFNNEIWDNNADWNGSTTFTAPVTGKYMFSGAIRINDILAQGGSVFGRMGTSNRNYLFGTITDADDIANATIANYQFQATVIADMDANDTMTMAFFSNFQTTIDNDAERTWLQGYLLG